jgi:hypothetical protein
MKPMLEHQRWSVAWLLSFNQLAFDPILHADSYLAEADTARPAITPPTPV